jgi:hypothetical protein
MTRDIKSLTSHEKAFEISTLLFKIKDIIPFDYLDNYELFDDVLSALPEEGAAMKTFTHYKHRK